jgi:ribosomal-protein-alanine N-acetyltransferase
VSFIHGKHVVLRQVEDSDFEVFYYWMNDPEVAWWMDYDRPFSRQDIADDISQARAEGLPFTIVYEDRPIGRIGLNRFRQRDQVASTYMFIGESSYRGRGLGSDAMLALLNFAFRFRGLRMVDLWVLSENDVAIRTYKGLGFREDGTLRERSWKYDRWMGHTWMSITREEFEELPASRELARPDQWTVGHESKP